MKGERERELVGHVMHISLLNLSGKLNYSIRHVTADDMTFIS